MVILPVTRFRQRFHGYEPCQVHQEGTRATFYQPIALTAPIS